MAFAIVRHTRKELTGMRSSSKLRNTCGLASLLALALGVQFAGAQSRNNPYSPSPDKRPGSAAQSVRPAGDDTVSFRLTSDKTSVRPPQEPVIIANPTSSAVREVTSKPLLPTETYKIGIGDVLFVSLKNSPNGSGYFTVRSDGTIDYPLAGERVIVGDKTVDGAKEVISGGIKLFSSPVVDVKVREFASHKITVTGSVENAGEKSLQREAMPLFAIRAEAVPDAKASKVRIRRRSGTPEEILDLHDAKADEVLVFPGDQLHFFGGGANAVGSYFISGEVVSGGQKDLTAGLTLYQAIVASGGAKGDPKKAVIRRKNGKGMLAATELNLRSIKDGKAMDPVLAAGDIVEIRN